MTTPSVSHQRPEDEKLGIGANLAYGLQYALTIYGGIVAVPLIIGQAAGFSPADIGLLIAASLFAGGLATLLQTLSLPFFGCQLPLVKGVSFSGVATMVAIVSSSGEGGFQSVLGAVIAASLIGLLITPVFSQVTKFFMVTLVETSADILAVGDIIVTKIDFKRLGNGLQADMLSSMIATIFGSSPQSAFAQNVGLVAVTGIISRYVAATSGVFLVVFGLLPVMGRVIAAVPTSVLGGEWYSYPVQSRLPQ